MLNENRSYEIYINNLGMRQSIITLSKGNIIKVIYENGDNSHRVIGEFIGVDCNEIGKQCLLLEVNKGRKLKTEYVIIKNIRSVVDFY